MYLFYLDESGEREYASGSRYFVVCTFGVPIEEWKSLNAEVLGLKRTYFNDINVEIKSNWLRNPRERKRRYRDQYGIAESELTEFTAKLYGAALSPPATIIASVIDKDQMRQRYKAPQSPSSIAYRLIIERVELFLRNTVRDYGIMIFDKITNAQFRRKGYENLLSRQHMGYLEKGTDFVQVSQIAEGLLFIPSHENNMLQLTDIFAYNVYRQFKEYGEEWDQERSFSHRYPYFARIEPKLYTDEGGALLWLWAEEVSVRGIMMTGSAYSPIAPDDAGPEAARHR